MPMAYPSAQRGWRWSDVKQYVAQSGWGGEERTTSFQSACYTLLTVHVRAWMESSRRIYQTCERSALVGDLDFCIDNPNVWQQSLKCDWMGHTGVPNIKVAGEEWDQCSRLFPPRALRLLDRPDSERDQNARTGSAEDALRINATPGT